MFHGLFKSQTLQVGGMKREDFPNRGSETEWLEETVIQLLIYAMAEGKGETHWLTFLLVVPSL